MNNYQVNYPEHPNSDNIKITGSFNKSNYETNKRFSAVSTLKAELAAGTQLWDLPCIRDNFKDNIRDNFKDSIKDNIMYNIRENFRENF